MALVELFGATVTGKEGDVEVASLAEEGKIIGEYRGFPRPAGCACGGRRGARGKVMCLRCYDHDDMENLIGDYHIIIDE